MSQPGGDPADRVPLVMSTVRIARQWIHTGRGPVGIDRRGLVIATLLCAALFACSFAIGRAASPGNGPREEAPSSLPVAFTGTAIPVSLSSAPAIELQTGEGTRHRHAGSQTVASRTARVSAQAVAEGTPRGQGLGGTEVVRSTSPASPQPPVAERVPAPATPVAPAGAQGSGGSRSQPDSGGGTSFDSSG